MAFAARLRGHCLSFHGAARSTVSPRTGAVPYPARIIMERMPAAQGLPARLWLPPSPPRFLPFSYLFLGSQPRGPCRWTGYRPACSFPSQADAAWGSIVVRWTDATLSTDITPATVAVTATTTIPGSIAGGCAADAARISHVIAMEYAGWPAIDGRSIPSPRPSLPRRSAQRRRHRG
jgi:hypothetical protein